MRYLALTFVLATSAGLMAAAPAAAGSLQEKIEQAQHDLEQLKRTIETTKKQRDRSRKKHDELLRAIERFDRQLYKERDEAAVINREIKRMDQAMTNMDAQQAVLRSEVTGREGVLAARLRRLYMEGRAGWFRPLLAADSYAQFQRRLLYLSTLAARERQWLEAHRRDVARLERLRVERVKTHEALLDKRARVGKQLQTMKNIRSKKHAVLAGLTQQTHSHEQRLATLEQTENRKEALLKKLNLRGHTPGATPAGSFQKGALLWPVKGKLVGVFGRQKHPTFETYVEKKGIEIATREGMAIRAVADGNVVYADWLKGYGLVVILDHGANYFTFYAHASALLVKEGEAVAKGAGLGETGASGLTDRVVLYFELRKGTKPVNPLHWFAKR